MATIGIEFALRANTGAFTQALARAKNAINDTRKGLKELDAPRELQKLLGPGLFLVGLKRVIDDARATRDEFERLGKPIDDTTRRIIEYGDSLDRVGKTATRFAGEGVAAYQRVYEWAGILWKASRENGFNFKQTIADFQAFSKTSNDLNDTTARVDAGRKRVAELNSMQSLFALNQQLADAKRASAMAGLSDQAKVNALRQDEIDLENRLLVAKKATRGENDALIKQIEIQVEKSTAARKAAEAEMKAKAADLNRRLSDLNDRKSELEEKLTDSRRDRFLPTLVELAGQQAFGEDDLRSITIRQARKVLKTEQEAGAAAQLGHVDEAVRLQTNADQLRRGLSGSIRSEEANGARDQINALEDIKKQIAETNAKLGAIFVVRK